MIVLGTIVKDKITGFTGMAVARTVYLTGCARVSVQATELHDGKPQEWVAFDEGQLEVLCDEPAEMSAETPGGPQQWEPASDRQ
jgi:hypothetical protein